MTEWAPALSSDAEQRAVPFDSGTDAQAVLPSTEKATVPVGVPVGALTVAVKVTASP